MSLVQISRALSDAVDKLEFAPPIAYVYNPLAYARAPHEAYLKRFGGGKKDAVLVGMNPGPFGMAQTGVPFGHVELVRDWIGVSGKVDRPEREHPKRPIEGFDCKRAEVSGARLWGFAKDRFGTPDAFFERFFVINYCPLVFMEESGRNFTPDKLPEHEARPLNAACDRALRDAITLLRPKHVIGVGAFAEARAKKALEGISSLEFGRILHPSPASPAANRDWAGTVVGELGQLGIEV